MLWFSVRVRAGPPINSPWQTLIVPPHSREMAHSLPADEDRQAARASFGKTLSPLVWPQSFHLKSFSSLQGIRPMIETVPLANAAEAYARMMRNEARFRIVLVTGQ